MNVAIALGSNLGDRRAHLDRAIAQLRDVLSGLRVSSIVETDPVDVPDAQPRYLNAVVVGETGLGPTALLERLRAIEQAGGRERRSINAARTIDLDIVLYGDQIVRTPDLEIPHPRFRQRDFVLRPLAELVPDWTDPITRKTVRDLYSAIC
jgi:2-amino-4-hydroxy-6-hydroxymethyldihydropteridine diphosphokinase